MTYSNHGAGIAEDEEMTEAQRRFFEGWEPTRNPWEFIHVIILFGILFTIPPVIIVGMELAGATWKDGVWGFGFALAFTCLFPLAFLYLCVRIYRDWSFRKDMVQRHFRWGLDTIDERTTDFLRDTGFPAFHVRKGGPGNVPRLIVSDYDVVIKVIDWEAFILMKENEEGGYTMVNVGPEGQRQHRAVEAITKGMDDMFA